MGKLDNFTIDQMAGSIALVLGALGGLLMIIWKSRCKELKCKICWGFWSHNCIREVMSDDEEEEKKDTKITKLKKILSKDKLPPRNTSPEPPVRPVVPVQP